MRLAPLALPLLLGAAECPFAGESCDDHGCSNRIDVRLAAPLESYELTVRFGELDRSATCPHRDLSPAGGALLECGRQGFTLDFGSGKKMAGVAFDEPLSTVEVTIGGEARSLELGAPDLAEADHCHDCSVRTGTLGVPP